jgi:hypothetical protein
VGNLKNGKGNKNSGTTREEEIYQEKEDLETLSSRMLKLSKKKQ